MIRIFILSLLVIICLIYAPYVKAQQEGSNPDPLDLSILDELHLDSLTLIDLLDSLLTLEVPSSYLSLNTGYISQITSSGRNLEVNQYGFNTGAGYYHKSGWFMNINGFWYSDFDPQYSLTLVSAGYLGILGNKFAFLTSLDHSFYTSQDIQAFMNSANITGISDFGWVEPYLDYSLYFGNGSAHRVSPGITLDFKKRNWGIFKSISFRPTISFIFGSTDIVNSKLLSTDDENFERYLRFRPRLREFLETNPTQEQLDRILTFFPRAQEFLEYDSERVFGLMNYGISLPLGLNFNLLRVQISYTYNIPVALPGELFELDPNDYISLSLSYKIKL